MRYITLLVVSVTFFVLPLFVFAALPAFYAFGGRIAHVWPCDEGILFSVVGPRPGVFLRTPVSVFFPTVIIPSIATLSTAGTVPIPCTDAGIPTGQYGLPIIIGGTALTPGR